jgi:hypothetical protein
VLAASCAAAAPADAPAAAAACLRCLRQRLGNDADAGKNAYGLYRSNQLIEPILMLDLRWFRPNINKNYVCFWYLYILSVPDVWFHFYQFL